MPDDLFSGDYSQLVGLVVVGFLVLVVVGVVLAVRSARTRGDEAEVDISSTGRAHDGEALRIHLRAAEQSHRDAQAAQQEAVRIALTTSAPPPPPPTV